MDDIQLLQGLNTKSNVVGKVPYRILTQCFTSWEKQEQTHNTEVKDPHSPASVLHVHSQTYAGYRHVPMYVQEVQFVLYVYIYVHEHITYVRIYS